ncbi:MAG: hypothetical protein ABIR06_19440 [Cyclobacteriaceae bacterium]
MLIDINTLKILLGLSCLMASISLWGQDTVNIRPFERYWTKARLIPKVGIGVQETAFAEIGIQLHKIYIHPLSLASAGPYLTVDGIIQDDEFIVGPKLGYEITAGLVGLALDATYYTDFDNESILFTPRAGISIMGFVNLFYGRNVAVSEYQFKGIDKNRFSLVFNLNKDYFNLRSASRKSEK